MTPLRQRMLNDMSVRGFSETRAGPEIVAPALPCASVSRTVPPPTQSAACSAASARASRWSRIMRFTSTQADGAMAAAATAAAATRTSVLAVRLTERLRRLRVRLIPFGLPDTACRCGRRRLSGARRGALYTSDASPGQRPGCSIRSLARTGQAPGR